MARYTLLIIAAVFVVAIISLLSILNLDIPSESEKEFNEKLVRTNNYQVSLIDDDFEDFEWDEFDEKLSLEIDFSLTPFSADYIYKKGYITIYSYELHSEINDVDVYSSLYSVDETNFFWDGEQMYMGLDVRKVSFIESFEVDYLGGGDLDIVLEKDYESVVSEDIYIDIRGSEDDFFTSENIVTYKLKYVDGDFVSLTEV